MHHSSLGEILTEAQATSERVNLINLKKTETVTMSQEAFRDRQNTLKERGTTPPPPSPELYKQAKLGREVEILEEAKATVKEAEDFITSEVMGKGTKFDDLKNGGLMKESLSVVFGKKR